LIGNSDLGPGDRSADLVGRIGQRRNYHQITAAHSELAGQRGHQFLGTDNRQYSGGLDAHVKSSL
jgi:hypothetical protein